jgi:hypothetical protein
MKPTQLRLAVNKTLITLKIDVSRWNMTALQGLLRGIERHHSSVGFSAMSGNQMIWQLYVDSFDSTYWSRVCTGNEFELYTQQLDRVW